MRKEFLLPFVLLTQWLTAMAGSEAAAHFPWLALDADGTARYFFGETIAQRNYKLPEKIAAAEVASVGKGGVSKPLAMTIVESDHFIGKQSKPSSNLPTMLYAKVTFGIYGGSKLDYYSQHLAGQLPKSFDDASIVKNHLEMHALAIDTDSGITVRVFWNDKPLSDVEVHLFCDEGHEEAVSKTDVKGEVQFSDKQVEEGLNGIMVGQTLDKPGKMGDREYKSESHYLTMTFVDPQDFVSKNGTTSATGMRSLSKDSSVTAIVGTESDAAIGAEKPYGDMPLSLTSFGAARHADTIYVYGGHTGEAHHYSTQEQSDALLALDLARPGSEWIEVSKSRRLQGLSLVAHGNRLIRLGGFEAMNKLDDEHDLRSTDEVMAFDLESKAWSAMPSLPEPRSSHDAIVVNDRLYVVGGWTLSGEETRWLNTAWSLDLENMEARWEPLPQPTFRRRAIALAAFGTRIYAIGGMSDQAGPTTDVDFFDTVSKTWTDAPPLNGRPMNGFGASAWQVGDGIIATTIDGDVQQLQRDGAAWQIVGKTRDARFFHRLLPFNDRQLIAIGGANMEEGKFRNVEVVAVP